MTGVQTCALPIYSPSGRLAETIPERLEQHPAQLNFPGEAGEVRYGEGIFVGYRGLQKLGNQPSYPFGHGLTYTTFEFSDLQAEVTEITPETALGEVVLTVSVTVTNTGSRSGVAVPQLYIGYPVSSVDRPPWELRGFRHLELGPGEKFFEHLVEGLHENKSIAPIVCLSPS